MGLARGNLEHVRVTQRLDQLRPEQTARVAAAQPAASTVAPGVDAAGLGEREGVLRSRVAGRRA